MLQCSNYKTLRHLGRKKAFVAAISCSFYQKLNQNAPPASPWRYERMEYFAGALNLRNLLSLAAKLRHLANDEHCLGDQALYLMTAEALEKRAEWLAATLPQDRHEQDCDPKMHTPVDVTI
jgi:hypothetical protein